MKILAVALMLALVGAGYFVVMAAHRATPAGTATTDSQAGHPGPGLLAVVAADRVVDGAANPGELPLGPLTPELNGDLNGPTIATGDPAPHGVTAPTIATPEVTSLAKQTRERANAWQPEEAKNPAAAMPRMSPETARKKAVEARTMAQAWTDDDDEEP